MLTGSWFITRPRHLAPTWCTLYCRWSTKSYAYVQITRSRCYKPTHGVPNATPEQPLSGARRNALCVTPPLRKHIYCLSRNYSFVNTLMVPKQVRYCLLVLARRLFPPDARPDSSGAAPPAASPKKCSYGNDQRQKHTNSGSI